MCEGNNNEDRDAITRFFATNPNCTQQDAQRLFRVLIQRRMERNRMMQGPIIPNAPTVGANPPSNIVLVKVDFSPLLFYLIKEAVFLDIRGHRSRIWH